MSKAPATEPTWSLEDSVDLYQIDGWGNEYFGVNRDGHLIVQPSGPATPTVDLKELVDELQERGIGLPILLRFSGLLQARIEELHGAFHQAIDAYGYTGKYRGVYPVKVNQGLPAAETDPFYAKGFHIVRIIQGI